MPVGIEDLGVYLGSARLDLARLAASRGLDPGRFARLLMLEKTVAMPCEDAVSFAVNAARPVVARLTPAERDRIEWLITCTESGIDFGKTVSNYAHDLLGLSRRCRQFEIKQACYSATAGLHTAIGLVLAGLSPGAKALVIATDLSHFGGMAAASEDAVQYAEPSSGAGAVALLIGDRPRILELDVGCSGVYGYEVMDTARPAPGLEFGDPELSLLSYLDCCEHAYRAYCDRVEGVDFKETFDYLAFHTPFGGMIKGAHRSMMRHFSDAQGRDIDDDFERRVAPGLSWCRRVGNIMGGTLFVALASAIAHGDCTRERRVGLMAYGSGCCSEFFSGVVPVEAAAQVAALDVDGQLDARYALDMAEYERICRAASAAAFGVRHGRFDREVVPAVWQAAPPRLVVDRITDYHRTYRWTA